MKHTFSFSTARHAGALLLALALALLVGCGGTKVYTIDKTVIYRDAMYNMSGVNRVSAREEAELADGSVVNIRNKDKKEMQALFEQNGEVLVSMIIDLDEEELVYLRMRMDNYSDYNRMKKKFDGAMKDITKFMADKKDTQLKLN
jgi:hypothetical protein